MLWHLSHTVGLRAVRRTYGGNIYKLLADEPLGWRGRPTTTLADGKVYVDDAWKTGVKKVTVLSHIDAAGFALIVFSSATGYGHGCRRCLGELILHQI